MHVTNAFDMHFLECIDLMFCNNFIECNKLDTIYRLVKDFLQQKVVVYLMAHVIHVSLPWL